MNREKKKYLKTSVLYLYAGLFAGAALTLLITVWHADKINVERAIALTATSIASTFLSVMCYIDYKKNSEAEQ